MAKELPYFKFEPNQWENGNIQLCSHELQGVFINVCSMYWQRLGDLPYKLALQKVCGGNATALDSLSGEGLIKVIDGMICIDFLNEQLAEFENTSKVNSENARLGWQKRRKDAPAKRTHSDPNARREEKKREDEIRGEEIKKTSEIFIIIDEEKIFDALPIMEYYEVQLNGMQKENHNLSWAAMVPNWMVEHSREEFKDRLHAKNSFKKYYFNKLKVDDWRSAKKSNGANSPKFSGDYSEAL